MSRSRSRPRDRLDDEREGPPPPSSSSSSSSSHSGSAGARMLKFLLAHRHVGSVIGRAGAMINTIQDKSGAQVTVSRATDPRYPGSDNFRIGCVKGDAASILTAMSLIIGEVQDCEQQNARRGDGGGGGGGDDGLCQVTILVPDRASGAVIGRQGNTIKRLQKESAATIVVARSSDCKLATRLSKERPVEIKCPELQGLLHAIGSILAALATSRLGPDYENETLEYPRDNNSGRNSVRGGRGGGRDNGGRNGRGRDNDDGGGGGGEERYDDRGRSRDGSGDGGGRGGYDDMGDYGRGGGTYDARGDYNSYGGRRDGGDNAYSRDYDSGYRGDGGRRDSRRDSFDDKFDRRDRHDSFGYSDSQSQNRGRNRSRSPPPRLDALATTEVQVGDHLVAKMLGKRGCNIRRMELETGAKITVSKRGVFYPGTNNRIVTIQGQHDVMGRVQSLLQQAISAPDRHSAVPSVIMPLGQTGGRRGGGGGGGGRGGGRGVGVNGAMIGGRDLVRSALEAGPGQTLPGCYVVAISNSCIGAVLGHGGAALHKMRNDSGAIVEVSKRDEFFMGGDQQRAIVLKGTPSQILQCQQQTLELMSLNGYHDERQAMQQTFADAGMGISHPSVLELQPLMH